MLSVTRLEDRTVPTTGNIDLGFGIGGFSTADFTRIDDTQAVALDPDGKIVVAGWTQSQTDYDTDVAIARFLPDGGLDPTFNGTGRFVGNLSSKYDSAQDLMVLDDGKILIAGTVNFGNNYDFLLARFNADGSSDGSFGNNGITSTNFDGSGKRTGSDEVADTMLRRSDGRILLIGTSNLYGLALSDDAIAIAQYSANGIEDTTFAKVLTLASDVVPGGYQVRATDAALDAAGGIIVVGSVRTDDSQPAQVFVVRYHANGTRDTNFGTVTFDRLWQTSPGYKDQVEIQADGKIVVAFTARTTPYSDHAAIARLNGDGTRDITFGANGVREYTDQPISRVNSLSIQPDGKLVIGGRASGGSVVARYSANGDPDPTFGVNGFQDLNSGSYLVEVDDLAIRPDGKLVLAGRTYQLDGGVADYDFGVVRLESDTPSAPLPAGVTVVASGTTTKEDGGGTQFRIILNSRPTSDVVITFTVSDPTEGWTSVASVTFTPDNWNVPRTIYVYGVDDTHADGDQPFTVNFAVTSLDPLYDGLSLDPLTFLNLDNDVSGGKGKKK